MLNNPMRYTEPTGMWPEERDAKAKYIPDNPMRGSNDVDLGMWLGDEGFDDYDANHDGRPDWMQRRAASISEYGSAAGFNQNSWASFGHQMLAAERMGGNISQYGSGGYWIDFPVTTRGLTAYSKQSVFVQGGGDCPTCPGGIRYGLEGAGYASGALGGMQIGMLEYRQSLSINSRVGTFSRFRIGYGQVGFASRALGKASTYAGAPLTTYIDYKAMQAGEIGSGRFSYRLGGTVSSIAGGTVIGLELGGPYGALGGTAIGLIFVGGEMAYDGLIWFGNELSRGMIQTENALKGGWYPGR